MAGDQQRADVSVIIVNHNAGARLLRCLAGLKAQTLEPLEVLLVDNASADGSFRTALAHHPWVTPMPMDANLGFAAANNRAAERARGSWIALLNPDAYPQEDWLEELLAGVRRWPGADAFGSTQLQDARPEILDGAGDCLHVLGVPYRGFFGWHRRALPPEAPVLGACAAAALYRRARFIELGGFDESFFCYCEDLDLALRLALDGGESVQLPAAVVRHEGSGITGALSGFAIYHGHRNRFLMLANTMPPALFWGLLPVQLIVAGLFIAIFYGRGHGGAYGRAVRDALVEIPGRRRRRARGQDNPARTLRLARSLVWSPLALVRRRGKTLAGKTKRGNERIRAQHP
mgnify:CR=1 FL=1